MDNSNQPINPEIQRSTAEWLNSYAAPAPESNNNNKKKLIKIGFGVGITIFVVVMGLLTIVVASSPKCLTAADFQGLTGAELQEDAALLDSLYSFPIHFTASSNSIDDSKPDDKIKIQKLIDFYGENNGKDMRIVISGSYPDTSTQELVISRIENTAQYFRENGISNEIITIEEAAKFNAEESEDGSDGVVIVSVESVPRCR